MPGETVYVPCDDVVTGRYVMIYIVGDGFTGDTR